MHKVRKPKNGAFVKCGKLNKISAQNIKLNIIELLMKFLIKKHGIFLRGSFLQ